MNMRRAAVDMDGTYLRPRMTDDRPGFLALRGQTGDVGDEHPFADRTAHHGGRRPRRAGRTPACRTPTIGQRIMPPDPARSPSSCPHNRDPRRRYLVRQMWFDCGVGDEGVDDIER